MSILFVGRLCKSSQFFVLCLVALSLLLGGAPAGSTEVSESPSAEAVTPDQAENLVKDATGKPFVFEEPSAHDKGKTPSMISPAAENCLDLPVQEELPRIAIIIDDMGYHQKIGEELLDLGLNLTFSFLPHAPFTEGQGERAWQMGRDILVHMPMEPRDAKWDPGPGALYLDESVENITLAVEENISLVPHAIGVNNHMGSRFTADRQAMHEVLAVLQKKGLFFVDSLTAAGSVGADEARTMGLKTGSRRVFLDNSLSQEDVCRQLKRLISYAKKHGSGIAIGHPNRTTINALKLCREILLKQVRIVGIHELVH